MPRAVERGPQQIGHAGVCNDKPARLTRLGIGRLLFQIDHSREQRAGRAHDPSSRLEHQRESRAANGRQNGCGVLLGRDDGLSWRVGNAQTSADVEMFERHTLGNERHRQIGQRLGGPRQRRRLRDLRADVHVQPDDVQRGMLTDGARHRARCGNRHAELVGAEARGDVRVALGVDVGVDADRHARNGAEVARQRRDAFHFAG